jgi:hypothetical protein
MRWTWWPCSSFDAVCINQADSIERMQQVELMRAIYESTNEAIVWLGDSPPGRFPTSMSKIGELYPYAIEQ